MKNANIIRRKRELVLALVVVVLPSVPVFDSYSSRHSPDNNGREPRPFLHPPFSLPRPLRSSAAVAVAVVVADAVVVANAGGRCGCFACRGCSARVFCCSALSCPPCSRGFCCCCSCCSCSS